MYLAWSASTGRGLSQEVDRLVFLRRVGYVRYMGRNSHGNDDLGSRKVDDQDTARRIDMISKP